MVASVWRSSWRLESAPERKELSMVMILPLAGDYRTSAKLIPASRWKDHQMKDDDATPSAPKQGLVAR
jgi:hypothetical protein